MNRDVRLHYTVHSTPVQAHSFCLLVTYTVRNTRRCSGTRPIVPASALKTYGIISEATSWLSGYPLSLLRFGLTLVSRRRPSNEPSGSLDLVRLLGSPPQHHNFLLPFTCRQLNRVTQSPTVAARQSFLLPYVNVSLILHFFRYSSQVTDFSSHCETKVFLWCVGFEPNC